MFSQYGMFNNPIANYYANEENEENQHPHLKFYNKGKDLIVEKKYKEAIKAFSECLNYLETNKYTEKKLYGEWLGIVHFERGMAYEFNYQLDQAKDDYETAATLGHQDAENACLRIEKDFRVFSINQFSN